MRAEIIAIGDELITGQRLDTNSQWLSQRLTELGVPVAFHTTIGDDLADNVLAFRTAIDRADVVVATGGLGPTADDLTREAIAKATRTVLLRDESSLERIRQLFLSRGREMPKRNEVQADFPEGSRPIPNPHGTAPGIEMLVDRNTRPPCALFALPGVPAELFEMWQTTVVPRIQELQPIAQVIRHKRIKCFGVGESQLEAMLPDLIRRDREPRVGITVSDATITLRITATGPDEQACFEAMVPTVDAIHQSLGTLVFGDEDDELEDVVIRLLKQRGLTIAIAEWATAGLVADWLKRANANDSSFVEGQIVDNLSVLQSGAEPHDSATVVAMAEAVRKDSGADIGLSIGAFPTEPNQPEACVYVCLALPDHTRKLRFRCASHPAIMRSRTAKQALNALRIELLKELLDSTEA